MANPNYPQPRIVVEESPWQTFFESLPDMLLSFQKLKLQAEENEKARQFQRANMYIRANLDERHMLKKQLLATTKANRDAGFKSNSALDGIVGEYRTGPNAIGTVASHADDMRAYEPDLLYDAVLEAENNADLIKLGRSDAITMDRDFDGLITENEIMTLQKAKPELLESLGVEQLPEAYMVGVKAELGKAEVKAAQAARFALNRELFDRYDNLLDKDEEGNLVQLYKTFDMDPNQRNKAELEQAFLLLKLGANPSMVRKQLDKVETTGPITYSFGDKTYTQVSEDQVTTEDDGTMTAMVGGEKIKVVGDIAPYPGIKFVTGERYKGKTGTTGVGPASATWTEVQEEFDHSVETIYGVYLSSLEDREAYVSDEIGADLMNPGKIKIAKGKMTREGANKVKAILGANILTLARWGEKGWRGIPFWHSELEQLLKDGNYEGVVDYFMDPETQTARLKELDLSDSDKPWDSAADKRKAENAMVLFKQHLQDYDMLDRPRDWLDDHPREIDPWAGKETRKEGRITGGAVPGMGEFTSYKGPDFESEQGIAALKGAQELIEGLPSDTEKTKARKKMRDLKIMLRDDYGYLQEYLDYLFSQ